MPPRRLIMTKGNRHLTRTCHGLQKEGHGPQSPPVQKSLQRSILLFCRLGGYCQVSILGIPKARKLAPTPTSPDGTRRIKRSRPTPRPRAPSRPTPWVRAPSRLTPRPRFPSRLRARAPSRPTPWVRAPSRPTPMTRFPSRPTGTHTAANHSRSKRMSLGQNSDTRKETSTP